MANRYREADQKPEEVSVRLAFRAQQRRAAIARVIAEAEAFARSVGRGGALDGRRVAPDGRRPQAAAASPGGERTQAAVDGREDR